MAESVARLLLVINQFSQGGSERYLFEVCSALDRRRFDVHILTRTGVDSSGFYYQRLAALGVPIHPIRPHVPDVRRIAPSLARWRPYRVLRNRVSSILAHRRIGDFLGSFDVIGCIQVENYLMLQQALRDDRRVVVHLMSNRFQYPYDPYDELPPDRRYHFVTFNRSQAEEVRRLKDSETFLWPLSMDFTGYPLLSVPQASGRPLKIGIFTRLSREKPLEPLFASFKDLLTGVDATLHIYGGGDPSIFSQEIRRLGIGARVRFEGHRQNMIGTVVHDELSMCWLMSVGSLLGYASIELGACGVPMVFWNFGSWDTARICAETDGAVHSFNARRDFVEFSQSCLTDRARLVELGFKLQRYVRERHDIHRNIAALQDYYLRIIGEPRSPVTAGPDAPAV